MVGPNYKRPLVNTPAAYRGAPELTPTGTPLGAEKYTSVFTDPVLQSLIAEALKNNYDVKIAAACSNRRQRSESPRRASTRP
jgi:multidrug efflux system outer membrane protein